MATKPPAPKTWVEFWDRVLDRLPGWPSERQFVTFAVLGMILFMLRMARDNGTLWDVEVFKVILQALALTGFLNMILAFHFAANKSDEQKSENTAKFAEAITAVATGQPSTQENTDDKRD